jgi:hypothetical protein
MKPLVQTLLPQIIIIIIIIKPKYLGRKLTKNIQDLCKKTYKILFGKLKNKHGIEYVEDRITRQTGRRTIKIPQI